MEREKDVLIMNIHNKVSNKDELNKDNDTDYLKKNDQSNFRATDIVYSDNGIYFKLSYKEETFSVYVPGLNFNNVYNALAAIAAVAEVEIDRGQAFEDTLDFYNIDEQVEFQRGIEGCVVIDHTLNSTPYSVEVALEVLKNFSSKDNKIIIFGMIPIIGEEKYREEQYETISKKLFEVNPSIVVAVGKEAKNLCKRVIELGIDERRIFYCDNGIEIYRIVSSFVNEDTSILFKVTGNQMKSPSFIELKNKLILEYE